MKLICHIIIILFIALLLGCSAMLTGCTVFEVISAAKEIKDNKLLPGFGGKKYTTKIETSGDEIILILPMSRAGN